MTKSRRFSVNTRELSTSTIAKPNGYASPYIHPSIHPLILIHSHLSCMQLISIGLVFLPATRFPCLQRSRSKTAFGIGKPRLHLLHQQTRHKGQLATNRSRVHGHLYRRCFDYKLRTRHHLCACQTEEITKEKGQRRTSRIATPRRPSRPIDVSKRAKGPRTESRRARKEGQAARYPLTKAMWLLLLWAIEYCKGMGRVGLGSWV